MTNILRIGEYASLGTTPFYFPLKSVFQEPNWVFTRGSCEELEEDLVNGDVDVALVSPLLLASYPREFLVFEDLGYAANRHVREMLLFTDMYLDDMNEMTVSFQQGAMISSAIVKVVLDKYLQYQNTYLEGWGNAEAFVLEGDSALRERVLERYGKVYDVGDLWSHYTQRPMIYYLWAVRKESMRAKENMILLFHRLLGQSLQVARSDWERMALLQEGYDWLKRGMIRAVWNMIQYDLLPQHYEGLKKFYEDCADLELIDDIPVLEFLKF